MRYRWTLQCPRCSKFSSTVTAARTEPHVNCGDCLWDDTEIVEFTVVSVEEPTLMDDDSLFSVGVGDVVRMKSFQHVGQDCQFSFKTKKGRVALFMLLGEENADGSESLDLEKRMNDLGWWSRQ